MGARIRRTRRALEVVRVARSRRLIRVLREIGVVGERTATREGAREFRLALEQLGTTFLKLGQLLSSRPDLLPDVYIEELSRLVDSVPPLPFAELEPIVQEEIGLDAFVRIDPEPLAAASIAQIHRALLRDGREVVVKIRRPGIEDEVVLDLQLLRSVAAGAERRSETAQLLQLDALADELESHLLGELDLVEEAANTDLIAGAIADFPELTVPLVIRPYVTERVLVLQQIRGEKVTAGHALPAERAKELATAFFRSARRSPTCSGSRSATACACPRASRSSGRRSPRRTRSRGRSTRSTSWRTTRSSSSSARRSAGCGRTSSPGTR